MDRFIVLAFVLILIVVEELCGNNVVGFLSEQCPAPLRLAAPLPSTCPRLQINVDRGK